MSGEIQLLILATLAVGLDLLHSVLSIPNIVAMGLRSSPNPDEEIGLKTDEIPCTVYYFAIQNNEEVPVEWGGRELNVLLTIRGDGSFREEMPLLLTCGPDDEVTAFWSRKRSEITLRIPRIRPLKTWVFKCYVDAGVGEMSLTLRIPTRSTVRRLAQRINATLFAFDNLDHHQTLVLTRHREDPHYSSRPFRRLRGLAWTIIPSSLVGGSAYYWFLGKLAVDFEGGDHSGILRFLVEGRVSGLVDLFVILAGSTFLYHLSQAREMPIAQGYQEVRDLKIAPEKPPSKSGIWSPRWTSKWWR